MAAAAWSGVDPAEGAPRNDLIGPAITYRVAVGPRTGRKLFTLRCLSAQRDDEGRKGVAEYAGFSLHAAVGIEADARGKLERLCRYVSRPAIAAERLSLTSQGDVHYRLKTPYRDGTTHVRCEGPVARPGDRFQESGGSEAPRTRRRSTIAPATSRL
jgi:hypothetical protein